MDFIVHLSLSLHIYFISNRWWKRSSVPSCKDRNGKMVRCPGSGNCASQIRPSAVHSGEAIRTVSNLCCYFKKLKTKHATMSFIMLNFNTYALCFSFWCLLYPCILCCFPYNVRKRRERERERERRKRARDLIAKHFSSCLVTISYTCAYKKHIDASVKKRPQTPLVPSVEICKRV